MARRTAARGDNPDGNAANRICGPQSALTDFLAANNISALQIRRENERRQAAVLASSTTQPATEAESSTSAAARAETETADATEAAEAADEVIEQALERTRKRKRGEKEAIENIKKAKAGKKGAAKKRKSRPDDIDDDDDEYNDVLDMYAKSKPMPGQLEHCELCSKRFTVTAYSKTGPNGGLLCTPCGKALAKDSKDTDKATQPKKIGRKRRQVESNRLDGIAPNRAKSLVQLCIEKLVDHHELLSELGDMHPQLVERLGQVFAKKRVLNSKTLKLFARPDVTSISLHDAAYIEVADYQFMFATASRVDKVVIRNACQFKDEVAEYMLEKCPSIKFLQLYAANLMSDAMWRKIFETYGSQLQAVKLQWLDASFNDDQVEDMVNFCPNITRLKFKLCRRLGQPTVATVAKLRHLQHLSLRIGNPVENSAIETLIKSVGADLRTLSLEAFDDLDNSTLAAIKTHCTRLVKLRISENALVEDSAFADLFTDWANPPLQHIDFNSTRDVDNNNALGPDEAIGLAAEGFPALMKHSGEKLRTLDISSCRHIPLTVFGEVFNGTTKYPKLEMVNLSFCSCVNTGVVAGIFKSCPALKQIIAFGCFDILDVVVPRGVVLIGVPRAQDAIEQIGAGLNVDEALMRMHAIEAA